MISVLSVIGLTMSKFVLDLSKSQKIMDEKFRLMELENSLLNSILLTPVCSFQLSHGTPSILDLRGVTASVPLALPINFARWGIGNTDTAPAIAIAGSPLPGENGNSLTVADIQLINVLNAGSPTMFKGDLRIRFNQATLTMARNPVIKRDIVFEVTPQTDSAAILGCGSPVTDSGIKGVMCGIQWTTSSGAWLATDTGCNGNWPAGTPMPCPTGYSLKVFAMVSDSHMYSCFKD